MVRVRVGVRVRVNLRVRVRANLRVRGHAELYEEAGDDAVQQHVSEEAAAHLVTGRGGGGLG